MNPQEVRTNAVHWEFGMLVTPEHFLRQERFYNSSMLWMLRYAVSGFGLIGGGARLPETEVGSVRHDPVITLIEDEQNLSITITQCRGLTAAGTPVDVVPEIPISRQFHKGDLEGLQQLRIYVVAVPHQYTVLDGAVDESNPQMQTERTPAYRVSLQPHGEEAQHVVVVGALRRSDRSIAYEFDPNFIPPCLHLAAFSELAAAWRRIVDQLSSLSSRFVELHRAMQDYIELARERGIDSAIDRESLEFVRRIVPLIENCLYDCLDHTQPPSHFFGHLRKFLQGAAVSLDLNPPVQQYFDALRNAGETEFAPLVEQQKLLLRSSRHWRVEDDLGVEVRSIGSALRGIETLERALEGKYIDFRVSPSLETMNFVFDRGGSALYKLAAKPARLQGFGSQMTFYFANVRLEGREKYRVILTSGAEHAFSAEQQLPVEIGINEGSGARRPLIHGVARVRFEKQRNVEFDFDAPDIATVTDLRIAIPAHFHVNRILLFVRHRFYAQDASPSPAARTERPDRRAGSTGVVAYDAPGAAPPFRAPLQPDFANLREARPGHPQEEATRPSQPEESAPALRRRRLE